MSRRRRSEVDDDDVESLSSLLESSNLNSEGEDSFVVEEHVSPPVVNLSRVSFPRSKSLKKIK